MMVTLQSILSRIECIKLIVELLNSSEGYSLKCMSRAAYSLIFTSQHWHIGEASCLTHSLKSVKLEDHFMPLGFSYIDYFLLRGQRSNFDCECVVNPLLKFSLKYVDDIGWGVFSCQVIPGNCNLLVYYGEYVNTSETVKRQQAYDLETINYVLTIREHTSHQANSDSVVLRTNVDATVFGGLARFVNHSCEPNCKIIIHRDKGVLLGVPILQSIKVIAPGEQITFDYGSSDIENCYDKSEGYCEESKNKRHKLSHHSESKRMCCCGARNCRGYLPST